MERVWKGRLRKVPKGNRLNRATPSPPTSPPPPPPPPPPGNRPPRRGPRPPRGVVDRNNPISFVLLGTLFGNDAYRNIQNLAFTDRNFRDTQMLRLTAGDANEPPVVDRIFNHTPHPATIGPVGGSCQVLERHQVCGNGPHNDYYNRYCRLHGDVGPGPRPIAGAVPFNICHDHRFTEDRSDEIEAFYIHALCGPCQTRANMQPGQSDCVCEAKLLDWCCRRCAMAQIMDWQAISDMRKHGMEEREHISYEAGNEFNRKRLCPVCRVRSYLGPRRVQGEIVAQVRWCPICHNLRRDLDASEYEDPPEMEDEDHAETDEDAEEAEEEEEEVEEDEEDEDAAEDARRKIKKEMKKEMKREA